MIPSAAPSCIRHLSRSGWTCPDVPGTQAETLLEAGDVLFLPDVGFIVEPDELLIFSPAVTARAKNVSFDPATYRLGGAALAPETSRALGGLMKRFSRHVTALAGDVLPHYRSHLQIGRTSFRPVEISGRHTSWRKDDTRLHVDSFPATPVHGRRILRVFTNINPIGRPRLWRVGDDFAAVARRFAFALRPPLPGSATLLRWLHVTKTRRSPYDGLMLQLHDRMKADSDFQRQAPQRSVEFPAGSTWMAFTDQVSHAAMAGQYQLEQTFLVPIEAMQDERRSPLRILEALMGRLLA
jgi:hypothetical protein